MRTAPERYAHELIGRAAGLTETELAASRNVRHVDRLPTYADLWRLDR